MFDYANTTVLVTGASSGIGAALARRLGSRARRIVLTARRTSNLEALAGELRDAHPNLEARTMACDLTDLPDVERLAERVLEEGGVDILVNNAGLGDHALFDLAEWAKIERMIRVNVMAPAMLAHRLLPTMIAKGRGGILNIGSGAGMSLMPAAATYVGTKHFLHGWSEVLRADLAETGVTVTEVCPGPVDTEFDDRAGIGSEGGGLPNIFRIGADQCAREALAGFARGQKMVFPGAAYRALMTAKPLLPQFLERRSLRKPSLRARGSASPATRV